MKSNVKEFTISTTVDGEPRKGLFKMKLRLSLRDLLRMDEFRRSLIGQKPEAPSETAVYMSNVFSKLWTHTLEAPNWWKDAGNGLDLEEIEPVIAVFDELNKAEKEYADELEKEAKAAKESLQSAQDK